MGSSREWIETAAHVATVVAVAVAAYQISQSNKQAKQSEAAIHLTLEQLELSQKATKLTVGSALRQSALSTKTALQSEPMRDVLKLDSLSCQNSPTLVNNVLTRAKNSVFEVFRHYDFAFRARNLGFLDDEDWGILCTQIGIIANNCVVKEIWETDLQLVATDSFSNAVQDCKER